MGYYTDFTIKANTSQTTFNEAITQLSDISGYTFHSHWNEARLLESKWYKHDSDMATLSNNFVDVLFEVCGVGEDEGDLWKSYYKNGKLFTSNGKIVFEDFDESKLN